MECLPDGTQEASEHRMKHLATGGGGNDFPEESESVIDTKGESVLDWDAADGHNTTPSEC